MRSVLPLAVLAALTAFTILGTLYKAGGNLVVEAVNLTESNPWVGGCDAIYVEVANTGNKAVRPGILVDWNPTQIALWAAPNVSIPPGGSAVVAGRAPTLQIVPGGGYAVVRAVDMGDPLDAWSPPVEALCNVSKPPLVDPFLNISSSSSQYAIQYPYGWIPVLYGSDVETKVNASGFYVRTGGALLALVQEAAGELPASVEYSTNCTIYLLIYNVTYNAFMPLNGTGTAPANLSGVVELVFPPHCAAHISIIPRVSFISSSG
jgi:hypothetical protein